MENLGLRLHYSNRTERLLDALVANLEARRRTGAHLLDAPFVVVPNRNVATWVQFGIARATGIAANLKVRFLRPFLGEVVAQARPEARIVDGKLLLGLVLELLHDEELLARAALRPVRAYLSAGGEGRDAIDLRRGQLAGRVAHFFEEYGYARPEMLQRWPSGRILSEEFAETEEWQRQLWLALWGRGGLVERRSAAAGQAWFTAAALFKDLKPREIAVPGEIHLFGISYVARAYQTIFGVLSRAARLNIYAVNPCMEFWEDLETDRERRRKLPKRSERQGPEKLAAELDPFGLSDANDTPALRLWGRPGRENIRLLNELTECEFEACFEDPTDGGKTLLRQIQRDILLREPASALDGPADYSADRSLTVLKCSGMRREAESIAGEIWQLVVDGNGGEGRAPLRFNDIAVILPAARSDEYQAHFSAVFREVWEIPHNIVDMTLAGESRVAEAIDLLLALPHGKFTRPEVMRVATHPSVMARFPDAEPAAWLALCEALGIAHGADHAEHKDTYIERDVLNWDQGVRRLALGAFMTGRRSSDERMLALGDDVYLPEEPGAVESASGFGLLVRSLIEDARFCREDRRLPMSGWIEFLRKLVGSYIAVLSDEDERAMATCLAAIQSLAEIDLGGLAGRSVSYRIPCELLKGALASAPAGRGQHLADGVVMSSFLPMRAIPFRVIFVAGLGERDFPSVERADRLDLRTARRHPGDVSPREQDKYMFLETLLCARERLYLSYVARNALTGDPLEPSSVIRELRHLVEGSHLGAGGFDQLVREPGLRRFAEPLSTLPTNREAGAGNEPPKGTLVDLSLLGPEARREAATVALRERLRSRLGSDRPMPDLPSLEGVLSEASWSLLSERLGLLSPGVREAKASSEIETVRLSVSTIRRFLECPMQGSAAARLGLREADDDEDLLAREDELFSTGRLEQLGVLRGAFVAAVGASGSEEIAQAFERELDERTLREELDGKMPTGLFATVERTAHLAILNGWWESLEALEGNAREPPATFRLGPADEHGEALTLLDPVVVDGLSLPDGRRVRVEIVGRTQPILRARAAPGSLLLTLDKKDAETFQVRALRGFVDHVVLAAANRGAAAGHRAVVDNFSSGKEGIPYVEEFAPIPAEKAREWLTMIAGEILGEVHDYLLPCEAVFELAADPNAQVAEIVEKLCEGRGSFSSCFGPVPQPRTYPPPSEEEAREIIEKRFGLYLRTRTVPESP